MDASVTILLFDQILSIQQFPMECVETPPLSRRYDIPKQLQTELNPNMKSQNISKTRIDEFSVLEEDIGSGCHSTVMLGMHQNKQYALKRYNKETTPGVLSQETAVLRMLESGGGHSGIIRFYGERPKASFASKFGKLEDAVILVMEYAEGGELLEYIQKGGCSEHVCRAYFAELVNAIQYMHRLGLCHRDLKPENIMLDSSGHLKLIDFGSSTRADKGAISDRVGTDPYMAPEVREGSYNGYQADIFSLGVILFTLYFGHPPFHSSKQKDPLYSHLSKSNENDKGIFWGIHKKCRPTVAISEDFKHLVEMMLCLNPSERLSLQTIRGHQWCKGHTATQSELFEEFSRRAKDC